MVAVREPVLKPVGITNLRPTQITVGMREVEGKRKGWREKKDKKAAEFLAKHMIPVILGPSDRLYIIDHHHLTRALHEEGVKDVLVAVVANLSMVDPGTFGGFSTIAGGCIRLTTRVVVATTRIFRNRCATSWMILSVLWPAN